MAIPTISPVATTYLVVDVGMDPFWVGTVLFSSNLFSIFVVQLTAKLADRFKALPLASVASAAALASHISILAAPISPWFLLIRILLTPITRFLQAGIFKFDEDYGPFPGSAGLYHTRLLLSLSFVIGPPVGFLLYGLGSFWTTVLVGDGFGFVALLIMWQMSRRKPAQSAQTETPSERERATGLRFAAVFAVMIATCAANTVHSAAVPLFLIQERGEAVWWPGIVMGFQALVEVFVIAALSRLPRRLDGVSLIRIGVFLGLIYFFALDLRPPVWAICALQVLYGAHYALVTVSCMPLLKRATRTGTGTMVAHFFNASAMGYMVGIAFFSVLSGVLGYFGQLAFVCPFLILVCVAAVIRRSASADQHQEGQASESSQPL